MNSRIDDSAGMRGQFNARATGYADCTEWVVDSRLDAEILRPLDGLRDDALCLDLGWEAGALAHAGAALKGTWVVAEPSTGMLLGGTDKNLGVTTDATHLPFKAHSFDFIGLRSLLAYADMSLVLAECARVLKPDGVIVIAEMVLGEYRGPAATWYNRVERLLNPLKSKSVETSSLVAAAKSRGFEVISTVELRRTYRHPLAEWLSRAGSVPQDRQIGLRELLDNLPAEVESIGLMVSGDFIDVPLSWAVLALRQSSKIRPSLVVSVIPVRLEHGQLLVYAQERRAALLSEPEYYGHYEFPQGHVEHDESLESAARRELFEESGLEVVRAVGSLNLSHETQPGLVLDAVRPDSLVVVRGKINFVSVVMIVEAREADEASGAVDNMGFWMTASRLREIFDGGRIYPLNLPMFALIIERFEQIKSEVERSVS